MIDGGIVITLVEIDRNKVRLGIEAPDSTQISREELLAEDDPRRRPAQQQAPPEAAP